MRSCSSRCIWRLTTRKRRLWPAVYGQAKGTVTGLTGGANYLGIVVAFHTTAYGLQTAYGVAPPIPVQSSGTSAATDRAALIALYNATGGANWNDNTNWLTNAPLEQWYGVSRDGNGRVAGLDLRKNQLTGELPPELGNLTYLVTLDLGSRTNWPGKYLPSWATLGTWYDCTCIPTI